MFIDYLERMREQPKETRRRFVLVWSIIITGLIVLVWLSVLFGKSYALRSSEQVETPEESIPTLETENIRDSFNASNNFILNEITEGVASEQGTSSLEDSQATTTENLEQTIKAENTQDATQYEQRTVEET
jgi:hypothetical protein